MNSGTKWAWHLKRDVVVVLVSILVALALSRSGFFHDFFQVSVESELVGILIAGLLFTSIFTTPLSIAMFVSLAPVVDPFVMAGVGALGAVLGDLILFGLVRHSMREDVEHLMSLPRYRRFFAIFHRRMFRWVLPFVGALIIASPLPDELGIGLMGMTRMKPRTLVGISYVMNALGIAFIGLAA